MAKNKKNSQANNPNEDEFKNTAVQELKLQLELAKLQLQLASKNEQEHSRRMEWLDAQKKLAESGVAVGLETSWNTANRELGPRDEFSEERRVIQWRSVLQALVPDCDDPQTDLIAFFKVVEELFSSYNIPERYQSKLIIPLLKSRGRSLLVQLTTAELNDYQKLKQTVLSENRLTPEEQRRKYINARRSGQESYVQFAARLQTLWHYYLESKNAKTFEEISQLILIDQFKDTLNAEVRGYIELQIGAQNKSLEDVSGLADIHRNAQLDCLPSNRRHISPHRHAQHRTGKARNRFDKPGFGIQREVEPRTSDLSRQSTAWITKVQFGEDHGNRSGFRCHGCKKIGQFWSECPENRRNVRTSAPSRETARTQLTLEGETSQTTEATVITSTQYSNNDRIAARLGIGSLNPTSEQFPIESRPNDKANESTRESNGKSKLAKQELQRVNIRTKEGKTIEGIVDSGCEMTVIHTRNVNMERVEKRRTISLCPAFGPSQVAQLIEIDLELINNRDSSETVRPTVSLMAATTTTLNADLLLTPTDYELLKEQAEKYHPTMISCCNDSHGISDSLSINGNHINTDMEDAVGMADDEYLEYTLLDRLFDPHESANTLNLVETPNGNENIGTESTDAELSEASKLRLEQENCPTQKHGRLGECRNKEGEDTHA